MKQFKLFLILQTIGFFSLLISCQQASKQPNVVETAPKIDTVSIPVFLVYGELPPVGYAEEEDSLITQKFGFHIKRIAGCEITTQLVDSVKTINQENNSVMKSKYGNDWGQKFETTAKLKLAIPAI